VGGPRAAAALALAAGALAAGAPSPRDVDVAVNSIGMRMVLVPAGSFVMGSPAGAPMRQEEETQRRVTLTRPFRVAETEVTQRQWRTLMPQDRSPRRGDDLPVTSLTWEEAEQFAALLSVREKATYRLPTEAEWEYACRAGGDGVPPPTGRDAVAWSAANAGDGARPVARMEPNAWGLFDMLGNVAEWTADVYGPYPRADETDPSGPAAGTQRVVRGGSWRSFPPALRCAARVGTPASYQLPHVGLRLVQESPVASPR
jgi:formylglycine-generating enzyme required for sulfatase activity